jgi:hypothetical protein
MPRITKIRVRRGSSNEWRDVNPVLADGEFGYDQTNRLIKIGNGQDPWNNLILLARSNPLLLESDSLYVEKLSVRSSFVNFKEVKATNIFTVPSGYVFSIDSFEVLVTQMVSPGDAPVVSFGNNLNLSEYCEPIRLMANSIGGRHIIENPQNAVFENLSVLANVSLASSANIHGGFIVISGSLIKI